MLEQSIQLALSKQMIDLNETVLEKRNFFNRLIIIYVFFGLLFLYFLYKTFSLQVSSYTDYEIAALENKTREILVQPRRGIIFDRNGKILVNNVPSYNLIISPSQIDSLDSLLNQIQSVISLSEEDIEYVNKNYQSRAKLNRELIIKRNLTIDEIAKFEIRQHRFPGVLIDERYTSKIASKAILDAAKNKKYRREKSNIDKVSASLILQS